MPFIVFEGLDGCGKTTLIKKLENALKNSTQKGTDQIVTTREPGGTSLGVAMRQFLLTPSEQPPVAKCEALLYLADRAQHVELVIKPSLNQGAWVLSDRFKASTVAFQQSGRKIPLEQIHWLNNFATSALEPDLTVLLDLSVEESQQRSKKRKLAQDRMESEDYSFHERVRQSFLDQSKQEKNWLVLDAAHSPEELLSQLLAEIRRRKWLEF